MNEQHNVFEAERKKYLNQIDKLKIDKQHQQSKLDTLNKSIKAQSKKLERLRKKGLANTPSPQSNNNSNKNKNNQNDNRQIITTNTNKNQSKHSSKKRRRSDLETLPEEIETNAQRRQAHKELTLRKGRNDAAFNNTTHLSMEQAIDSGSIPPAPNIVKSNSNSQINLSQQILMSPMISPIPPTPPSHNTNSNESNNGNQSQLPTSNINNNNNKSNESSNSDTGMGVSQ